MPLAGQAVPLPLAGSASESVRIKSFLRCDLNTVADARFSLALVLLAARGVLFVYWTYYEP
jgi:hypothetical protein